MPESDLRVIAPDVGGGFGQKMSLAPGIRDRDLARAQAANRRSPGPRTGARISSPASTAATSTIALEGAFDADARLRRALRRHPRQYRRLFVLSDHLRGRAADGDGGDARPLRRARICLRVSRCGHQYLPDGALSRGFASGDHVHDRAADGQGRRRIRHRSGRNPPAQPDPHVPLYVRDGSRLRRGDAMSRPWRRRSTPSTFRPSARVRRKRARRAAISASAWRRFPSAPATARRPSRHAAWR